MPGEREKQNRRSGAGRGEREVVSKEGDAPPPQELTWDSTLLEFLGSSYNFSDELIDPAKPPRFIRMYPERWQVNWQDSGVEDPAAQTIVDITFSVRPVAPAEITVKV